MQFLFAVLFLFSDPYFCVFYNNINNDVNWHFFFLHCLIFLSLLFLYILPHIFTLFCSFLYAIIAHIFL